MNHNKEPSILSSVKTDDSHLGVNECRVCDYFTKCSAKIYFKPWKLRMFLLYN